MSLVLAAAISVALIRVPGGGVQPQTAVDAMGRIHLVSLEGAPASADVVYRTSIDRGATWSAPIRVNSTPGAAIAAGTVRGAQLALGRNGRPHVVWMGSQSAAGGPNKPAPLLYSRLGTDGKFEAQRNLIRRAWGLDGGPTIAAAPDGRVWAFWHAPAPGEEGEENRTVWMTESDDDGASFKLERAILKQHVGACACCAPKANYEAPGVLRVLFRTAREVVHRDMMLLESSDGGHNFTSRQVDSWQIGACVMSTSSFAPGSTAWETEKKVVVKIGQAPPRAVPVGPNQKHPNLARNGRGETLAVWTEGTAWAKGGSIAWQIYDAAGNPEGETGRASGLPVWGLAAAVPLPGNGFAILY
jgi:hypothetical protein